MPVSNDTLIEMESVLPEGTGRGASDVDQVASVSRVFACVM